MSEKDKSKHITSIGGQAVIEGVMMRGPLGTAIAVRKPDGEIIVKKDDTLSPSKKPKVLKLPVIRGVVSFIESLVIGVRALMYSAEFYDIEEEEAEPGKFELFLTKLFGENLKQFAIYFAVFLSLILGIGLFILLPTVIASTLRHFELGRVVKTIIEGLIRIAIFLVYLAMVSKMKDIQRVFEYHGAEHKTIFAYENGEELTVQNVRKYSRFHPRCGTSFLLIVMVVSIIVFSFLRWDNVITRMLTRLALLPLVAGVSYEIIKWAGRSKSPLVAIVSAPGLWLQKLTTREPDDSQIEVAIEALQNVKTDNKKDDQW